MEWRNVWRAVFPRRVIERDVREEIAFHIEGRIRELVEQGVPEAEARHRVLARFGDVESIEEACRRYDEQRVDGETWRMIVDAWIRELKLSWRSLRRSPGFTSAVFVTLALGIGATTAVFSVVEGVLLRPLPFAQPDELAVVWQNDRATGTVREAASTSDYYDYVERSRAFESLAMHATGTAVLTRPTAPATQWATAAVTQNLLDVLGAPVQLGRFFTEEEDSPGGPRAVVLTDRVWQDMFGSDPNVLGRILTVDGLPHEVIGVLSAGLDYPTSEIDVWVPIQQSPLVATRPNHWVRVVGRMAPGVTVAMAQDEMTSIMAALETEYPQDNTNRGAFVEALPDVGRGDLRGTLWVLFAAVLAVLAIACVNVANLLLARGTGRRQELAVLSAVGAGARQITRRFFAEGLLMTVVSGVAGVVLAGVGVRVLTAIAPPELTALGDPSVNGAVLLFVLVVTGVICVGFALVPATQARRLDLNSELKDGRSSKASVAGLGVRRALVTTQLSLAVVLLIGATLLIGTVRSMRSIDPGFRAENTLRVDFALPDSRYPTSMAEYPDWPEIHGPLEAIEAAAAAVPGVSSAAVVMNHPLDRGFTNSFSIEGQPYDPDQGEIGTRIVSPSYFETSGLRLVEGRFLESTDRVGSPNVIMLNRTAARRYFPEGDALGSRLRFWGPDYREVVGIVEDERILGLTADAPPAMYLSLHQAPPRGGKITLMARTEMPPLDLASPLQAAIQAADSEVPVFNVSTMEATVADAMGRERFASTVLGLFSLVAVLLAVLGVHGVLAYLVAQRGHEMGVRMAMGATASDVVRMVMRQGASLIVIGVIVGVVLARGLSRGLESLLYGISPTEPWAYFAVATLLAVMATVATVIPARRAASIDPVQSLRGE